MSLRRLAILVRREALATLRDPFTVTILIAVPSAVKVFNWLGTMWRGQLHFHVPMLNAIGFVSMFTIGGLSGIFMAATPVDTPIPTRNTTRTATSEFSAPSPTRIIPDNMKKPA